MTVESCERLTVADRLVRAYLAGIIDGEGYIGICRRYTGRAKKWSPAYSVRMSLSMTDREPVELFAFTFGGSLRRRYRPPHKPIWELTLTCRRAATVIRALLPYLRAKRRQAETVLAFDDLRRESRAHRRTVAGEHHWGGGRFVGRPYRVFRLDDDFLAACDALYQRALRLSPRSGEGAKFRARVCAISA